MMNEKKISKTGSITIPGHLRRELGLTAGEKVKIEKDEAGNFFIQRIEGSCIFCGTNEDLTKVRGKFICAGCAEEVIKTKEKGENHEK
ncbi:AbrB family transcriptional regulator [Lachnospiraceae bacterium oral taxon 500]|nr:AbrB family transcriptional regulator [Lachnospiraceae bacterium oral taxon 500]